MIVIIILVTIFLLWIRLPKLKSELNDKVIGSVSVIIAVRNEAENLGALIKSFENQVGIKKEEIQIIVVNDYSEDESLQILNGWAEKSDFDIRILDLKVNSGKKSALKEGVLICKYDCLLFTDADCEPTKYWISTTANQFKTDNIDLLIGCVWFKDGSSLFSKLQKLEFSVLQAVTAISTRSRFPFMCNGANLMTKKTSYLDFLKVDKNQKRLSGDDVFYLDYLLKNKGKIQYSTNSSSYVLTNSEETLSGFIQQRLRWSSKVKFYRNPIMVLPSLFFSIWSLFLPIMLSLFFWLSNGELLTLLGIKITIDFCLVLWFHKVFGRTFGVLDFIILEIIHPIYVLGIGILSIFKSFNWKNREAKA